MNKVISTLLALCMLTVAIAAATTAPTLTPQKKMTPLQEMLGQLNLSEEQKKKIEPVLMKQAEAQKALRADTALAEDARKSKNQEIQKNTNNALKEILTSEQWEKLKELRKARAQQQQSGEQKKP